MKRYVFSKLNPHFFCLAVFISVLFVNLSCSQNVPELKTVNSSVIFDFSSETSGPVVRYSFFIESSSDARRAEEIEVQSKKDGLIWKCDDLIKAANSKHQWAGYSNFVIPDGIKAPSGTFLIKYTTADGQEVETNAFLNYDVKFLSATVETIPDLVKEKNGKNNIAVFNRDNKLLYYGEKNKDFRDENTILRKYRDAYYYRDIWVTGANSVMCLMPKTLVRK